MFKRTLLATIACLFVLSLGAASYHKDKVSAVTASDWKAGRIIDDVIFTDKNALNVDQIQAFLNSKVGTGSYGRIAGQCDVNGVATSEYGGGTRAQYGASRGNPAPFTCLKDYYEVPKINPGPGVPASNYGGVAIPAGARSAAQLIWDAAQRYNINPKVLLVTIQKESAGPLTTDDWPFRSQYTYAMGAHCPDSGPGGSANCDPDYAGFSIQISESAALLRWYLDNMSQPWWSYKKPGNNSILYNPNTGCGSSNVNIETMATAALYTYTPYQPNQPALDNMYGLGDGCSAYGNRNFWRIYNDWFGSTTAINGNIQLSTGLVLTSPSTTPSVNDVLSASYEIKNTSSFDDYVGGVGVCARMNGQNYDFGFTDHQYIPANGKVTVTFQKRIDVAGTLFIFACSYHPMLGWASTYYPYDPTGNLSRQTTIQVQDSPLVTSGVSLSPANPAIGQEVTATTTLRNTSVNAINIGSLVIAGRDPSGQNTDFGIVNDVNIPAGGTYSYSQKRTFAKTGNYSFFIANWNGVWTRDYPHSLNASIIRQLSVAMLDNPLVSAGITLSPTTPVINQPVTATMTIRNVSATPVNIGSMVIAARGPSGQNTDFAIVNDVIIPANGTYTYSKSQTFTAAGNYTLFIANWNGVWSKDYPKSLDSTVLRQLNLTL